MDLLLSAGTCLEEHSAV